MKTSDIARCAFTSTVAAALLAGCGGGSQPPGTMPQSRQNAAPTDNAASWVSPAAKKNDLIYASKPSKGEVLLYAWPGGELEGRLSGFEGPQALCVDGAGNVYVPDSPLHEVDEYAHGNAERVATWEDESYTPIACSVDPTNGNLATSNYSGTVSVYRKAASTPEVYTLTNIPIIFSVSYDNKGDLFAAGDAFNELFALDELQKGSNTFHDVALNMSSSNSYSYSDVAFVQWYAGALAVDGCGGLCQLSVTNYTAKVVGGTHFGPGDSLRIFSVNRSILMLPGRDVFLDSYPSGNSIGRVGPNGPHSRPLYSAVLSPAK